MKILFCDLNGTLIDDTRIWEESFRALFHFHGKKPPTIGQYFSELETGDYLEVYRRRGIMAPREELNAMYEAEYKKRAHTVELYPHVRETLQFLFERRVILALITAQPQAIALPMLEKFKIDSLFRHFAFHALDKKTHLSRIVAEENTHPHECYFVGDAPSDMRHAKAVGIQAVAFLNGHVPQNLMSATKPHHYIYSFHRITSFL